MSGKDQLLECLLYFCNRDQISYPGDEILSGMPCDDNGHIVVDQFLDLAQQLGYDVSSQQVNDSAIEKISSSSILLLKDNKVVVLLGFNNKEALIADPNNDFEEMRMPLKQLKKLFDGYIISLQVRPTGGESYNDSVQVEPKYKWMSSIYGALKKIYPYVIFSSLFVNLLVFVVPLFIMNVYDRVIPNKAVHTLWGFAIGALVFIVLDLILKICRGIMLDTSTDQVKSSLNSSLFKHNLNLRLGANELGTSGYLSLSQEIVAVRQFLSTAALTVVVDLPFFILYLFVIYILAGILVVVPIVGIICMAILDFSLQPSLNSAITTQLKTEMVRQSINMESITFIKTVKALVMEKLLVRRFSRTGALAENKPRLLFYQNLAVNISSWLQQTFTVVLIIVGAFLVMQNKITEGTLVATTLISARALAMTQVSNVLFQFNRMRRALRNIDKIMQLPKDHDSSKQYFYKENLESKIFIDNVSFSYPDANQPAISNISLQINPGEHVSILGNVGSGKTTLFKLLVNFIEPSSGVVWVDTFSARELDPYFLRTNVHYMSAECSIFRGSVLDNLKIANHQATSEEIVHAAKLCGVTDFVLENPRGFEMILAEKGENLSSGQRQSICLARAMLSPAKILLLDEPTANFDLQNGILYMKNFFEACSTKTILMITHRLDLCQYTDRAILFDNGEISKDGQATELVRDLL